MSARSAPFPSVRAAARIARRRGPERREDSDAGRPLRLHRRQLLVFAGAGVATASAAAGLRALAADRLPPGTLVAGVDVGGRTRPDAVGLVRDRLAAFERTPVTLRLGERSWTPSAADLGLAIDYEATVANAAEAAGAADSVRRWLAALDPTGEQRTAAVAIRFDEARMRTYLDRLNREVAVPPRDARLVVSANGVTVEAEEAGSAIATDEAVARMLASVERLEPTEVPLPLAPAPPRRTAADLAATAGSAARLTERAVTLRLSDRRWQVEPADLLAALALPDDPATEAPHLDPERLIGVADRVAAEVDHAPVNATLGWDGGIVVTDPGYAGTSVDVAALAAAVAAAAETTERTIDVPVVVEPPALREDNLAELGIATRMAVGTSSFAGSSEARATNVAVAAGHVSPTLVPPGEAFSFNAALGPITTANGYVEGKIILGDWFTSDLGGGVCQVSTTVFRAALLAGLPFVEWYPHTFRLSFYELDGWSAGKDAAIYQSDDAQTPSLDLRFANPTAGWLLLQVGVAGDRLVAELYGPSTGYEVRIDEPQFADPVPAPPPVERVVPERAPGEREVVQQAQPGVTVRVRRRVTSPDGVALDTTFVSPYRPQAEVVEVGAEADAG